MSARTGASALLAILGYHKIGDPPDEWWSWYYVPEEVFEGHVQLLRDDGWTFVDLQTLLSVLRSPVGAPERMVLVTFDDAYRSLRGAARRCLRRHQLPAVVFVPTDYVGGWNAFDEDVEPREEICDWEDLRALAADGFSIQSHTASHRALSNCTAEEVEGEARRSRAALQAGLGAQVSVLSYPYGDTGAEPSAVADILGRSGYAAACGYGGAAVALADADRWALPRLTMGPDTDLRAALAGPAPPEHRRRELPRSQAPERRRRMLPSYQAPEHRRRELPSS